MIVLIDNYDSFTFNLFHYLGGLGADVAVHRNDKITVKDVLTADPEAIVLSPGPCTPNDAGICLELIEKAAPTIPILGVCLGHQAIGQAFGGEVVRAPVPVHGKLSEIKHEGAGVFRGINAPDGARAQETAGARRAIPSRKHRFGTWPSDPAKFSRPCRQLERRTGAAGGDITGAQAPALRGRA